MAADASMLKIHIESSATRYNVRSGGGAMAGKSEDEQLAMALSLSAGLAIKARLEARLLPEPETGAGAARGALQGRVLGGVRTPREPVSNTSN